MNSQVSNYLNQIDSAQIRTQKLFAQLTAGNHDIYQTYLTTANIFSALQSQNSTASKCVSQYGIAPAIGNYTNMTNTAVESAMQGFQDTFNSLTNTIEIAQGQILDMIENIENCFSTYVTQQSKLMLNICSTTAVSIFLKPLI